MYCRYTFFPYQPYHYPLSQQKRSHSPKNKNKTLIGKFFSFLYLTQYLHFEERFALRIKAAILMHDKCIMYIMALSLMAHFMWSCGLVTFAYVHPQSPTIPQGVPLMILWFKWFLMSTPSVAIMQCPHWDFTKDNYSTLYGITSLKCVFRRGQRGMICDNTNV